MAEAQPWHRLFGLSLMDLLHDSPVVVEMEYDLSKKLQLLDVLVVRREGPLKVALPDGFDELAAHNLISFKSYQEALDHWAVEELVGHYVNYRKQASPSMQDLLPAEDFRLYAVTVRYPQGLAAEFPMEERSPGVYDLRRFGGWLRVVVVSRLPLREQNAVLHLFSAQQDQVTFAVNHYGPRSPETSTILRQLLERYREEGVTMSEVLDRFVKEAKEKILQEMTVEERLEGVPAEDRLEDLSVDEILAALPPEKREAMRQRLLQEPPTEKQP